MEVTLWEKDIPYTTEGADSPNFMTVHLLDGDEPRPCVVVLPGGGYHTRAAHEGKPIAEFFNSRGMHAAVVEYRVAPNRFPSGLADVQRAVRILRANAGQWHIDADRVMVCGFSAGGHLAASSILWEDVLAADGISDPYAPISCRPNGAILCYPVISVEEEYGHTGSGKNLLSEERWQTDAAKFSLQNHVTAETPKVFLWHTSDDSCVNVKNSLIFAEKLRDNGIPFELHIYPQGPHGLGLASNRPDVSGWADLAADWILRNFAKQEP